MTMLSLPTARPRPLWHWRPTTQGVTAALLLLFCGGLVGYPIVYLVLESFNTGDAQEFPPESLGLDNYVNLIDDSRILTNTAFVACIATIMAVVLGFLIAWTLTRTRLPGRARLERLMQLPYYLTPLVGALAWAILAAPKSGFLNQLWHLVGGSGDLFNIYSAWGIAWVMALFEGTVAFVMIGAAMKSMDPSLEESSRVLGAGKWRTMLKITLPLVTPGVLVAAVLPLAALTLTSFQRFATVFLSETELTLANYETAFGFGSVNSALGNSLLLGVVVATAGVLVLAVLVWIIYRSRVPGAGLIEYVVMFPQAVPRMVFGLGLLWAWLNIPIPIYGTLWLLAQPISRC